MSRIAGMSDPSAIQAILDKAALREPLERLTALPPNQAQSALLWVMQRLAARNEPHQMLAKYEKNRFAQPGRIPPERMRSLELLAFRLKPDGFESVELSPVTLLGSASGFGCVSQHKVVSALRGTEVVSDATNALALEAALRRKRGASAPVHLCAAHRLMRAQSYANPNSLPHFNMFSLVSAGAGAAFEPDALRAHVGYHARLLRAAFGEEAKLVLKLSAPAGTRADQLADAATRAVDTMPNVAVERAWEPSGGNYYNGFRFQIGMERPDGGIAFLADGGPCDWTARLLSDGRERLITSGAPLEALATMQ